MSEGVRRGLDRISPLAQHDAGGGNRTADPGPERTTALTELRALGERRGDERVEERPRVRGANGPSTRRRQGSNTKVSRNGVRAEISALSR